MAALTNIVSLNILMYSSWLTCTLNFQSVPTGTPGMGPKWLDGTMVHTFVLPTQAIPWNKHTHILSPAHCSTIYQMLQWPYLSPVSSTLLVDIGHHLGLLFTKPQLLSSSDNITSIILTVWTKPNMKYIAIISTTIV